MTSDCAPRTGAITLKLMGARFMGCPAAPAVAEWSARLPARMRRTPTHPGRTPERRTLAAHHLTHERRAVTPQPTALVLGAYLRMVGQTVPDFNGRNYFFGIAARLMRQVLVDARPRERRWVWRAPTRAQPCHLFGQVPDFRQIHTSGGLAPSIVGSRL